MLINTIKGKNKKLKYKSK